MRTALSLLVSLLLPLATSCGGGGGDDPASLNDSGNAALNEKDYDGAKADFDKALELIGEDTAHPDYLIAKLGSIEARAKSDASGAVNDFLALAQSNSGVTDRHFFQVGRRLGTEKNFEQGIEIAKAGKEKYPDSKFLTDLVTIIGDWASEQEGGLDPAMAAQLAGLGYAGGD